MSGFRCPFCGMVMAIDYKTTHDTYIDFEETPAVSVDRNPDCYHEVLIIRMHKCPNCGEIQTSAIGYNGKLKDQKVEIRPRANYRVFPDYVPPAIKQDYVEACSIVDLSPKASATLCRRCLQGMIRDYWDIKKDTLSKAIDELKGKVPPAQWEVIDGVRRIGNIGAHMERDISLIVDIDQDEARDLIELIELLVEQWYINRHDQEELYKKILKMDAEKQTLRKS